MPERLKAALLKAVGAKQTMRAIQLRSAGVVYIAADADRRVIRPVLEAAAMAGLEIVEVESKTKLGRLCGIDVGAACAALVTKAPMAGHHA